MTTTYTVQPGDTLSKIAAATGMSVTELAKQNGIEDINKILVGQKLSLGEVSKEQATPQEEQKQTVGMDAFQRESSEQSVAQTYAPLAYGLAGAALYEGGKKVLPKLKDMSETARLRFMYGKDAVKTGAQKTAEIAKNNAGAVRNFVSQKAKHIAKSAELHYAFGKDAVQKGAKKAVQKAKVGARYTRFIGNTKIAPKLIKGASRYAGPIAAIYGAYEVKQAYDEGGEKAAVKQAIKTGGGLAGGWAGAKAGAALGSFAGPIGTVAGGIIGGIAGYLLGEKLFS